jgi:glycosyltransferase involved in cell wall biosynthesis
LKKSVLLLTQYYLPETGAPQNRLSALAHFLNQNNFDVEILTALPNYPIGRIYDNYENRFYSKEQIENILIHRAWIYTTAQKGIVKRLFNYFSFVFTSAWIALFKLKQFDYVFCESPPLFLGLTARWISIFKGSQLIFNVSDLWPESAEKLGIITSSLFLKPAYWLENRLYKKSFLITGQTKGICNNIKTRHPNKSILWLPNGINTEMTISKNDNWRQENGFSETDFLIIYAGILGHAQALETIIEAASKLKASRLIKFVFFGDGPEKEKLFALKNKLECENIYFFGSVDKSEINKIVTCCNMGIVHLKKIDLFKGAIPSKIFEYVKCNIPVLLGAEGEVYDIFVDQNNAAIPFIQEDSDSLKSKLLWCLDNKDKLIAINKNAQLLVKEKFNTNIIFQQLIAQL